MNEPCSRAARSLALLLLSSLAFDASAQTGTLREITSFGANPSQLRMYLYRPLTVRAKPPVVVAVHWCHGDGLAMYNGSEYARLADRYGYLVVYPSVTQASDGCFDVASTATLTHGGGSDSLGIVSMVQHALQTHGGDASRVYVTGVSSGAMMTNVLLGAYPDVFQAGAAFAGVPFGCFAGPSSWNPDCAAGRIDRTAQQWGDLVRAAHPGHAGPRPRMQLWHGTADEVLSFVNFGEEIEQWTNVLGVSPAPVTTELDTPQRGWTRTRYGAAGEGAAVEAIRMQGVVHNLPVQYAAAIHFFGLDAEAPDTHAPSAPMDLAAPARTSTSISLTWSASTDDVGVTGYDVYDGATLAASVAVPGATITGLAPSSTHGFTVRARDAAGNVSASSAALTVTTADLAGGAGGCVVTYRVASQWSSGFTAGVTITNTSGAAVDGWALAWTFPGGQTIGQIWNATAATGTSAVTAASMGYNASIPPRGGSVSFGFLGTWAGSGTNGAPVSFTLNGGACTQD